MLEPKLYDDFDKFIFNLDKTTYLAHKLAKTCEKEIKKQKMLQNTTGEIEILENLLNSFNKINDKLSDLYDDTEMIEFPEEEEEIVETKNNIIYFKKPNDTK